MTERLVNINQLEEEKILYSKYGFYLLDGEDKEGEAFRRYVYCNDMLNSRKLCEETGELPLAIRIRSLGLEYEKIIELDFDRGTIDAKGCYDAELFKVLLEIMHKHNQK